MLQVNDLSRSLVAFDPISTLMVVVEMSKASWLVRSVVPGVERQPLKKLEPDATALLRLIERWRTEAVRALLARIPLGLRLLLAIQPSPSTSPRSLRDDSTPPTDGLSRLSGISKLANLPA